MTPEEIKTLGHAFFDGKTLQYEEDSGDWCYWEDWIDPYCPNFRDGFNWRIKPDESKKVKFFGWLGTSGELRQIRANESWPNQHGLIRIPELDCEITLPEGEQK